MLGLAKLMLHKNIEISGSDYQKSIEIENLKRQGVKIFYGHKKSNISLDLDLVVYTGAISQDNIELVTARSLGIKTMERSEFLGEVSSFYDNVIAISGTHGKTTTTALIGLIFKEAHLNPTIHIGGEVLDFNSNFVIGDNKYFITEACEYRESFKYLKPTTSVITNIESDHLDYYKTFDNLKIAFNNFAKSTKKHLVLCNNKYIDTNNLNFDLTSVGVSCLSHICACNIMQTDNGYKFGVREQDKLIDKFEINLLGFHNIYNVLCAIAVSLKYGIDIEIIKKAIHNFQGVKRRYEEIGKINNIPVICDYAHHPTEIENSIDGIKEKYRRVLCVFQPHTYTRTINLKEDFVKSLKDIDKLAIFKTYSAREKYQRKGSARALFRELINKNKAYLISNLQLKRFLNKNASHFDVILVLGAGDIYNRVKKVIFSKKIC